MAVRRRKRQRSLARGPRAQGHVQLLSGDVWLRGERAPTAKRGRGRQSKQGPRKLGSWLLSSKAEGNGGNAGQTREDPPGGPGRALRPAGLSGRRRSRELPAPPRPCLPVRLYEVRRLLSEWGQGPA